MKKVLLAMVIIVFSATALAMGSITKPAEKNYTGTFDSVFSIISKSTTTTGILYERVAPFANLVNYNSNVRTSVDTSNFTHFIQAYSELYRSAFDTSVRQPWSVADFESQIENYDSSGVVDIGILHYNFNTMDSLVAMQKLIIVDSVLIGEDTAVTASLYSRQTAKCDLNIQLIYDCECLGTFNLNIHNSKSELEHYFEQNASNLDMIFENNNLHKSFDRGTLYQNILLPKKVCLEMLNIDSSLFIKAPEIVKGVDYDTLQFELEPEKICEELI